MRHKDVQWTGRLQAEVEQAGFVDLAWPDVGAEPTIGFMVATKPA